MNNLKTASIITLAIVLIIGIWTFTSAAGDEIFGCVGKTGALRIVQSLAGCTKNETPLSWNKEGVQGPKGDSGPAGSSFHLFDANNQDLGIVLDADLYSPSPKYRTFFNSIGTVLTF